MNFRSFGVLGSEFEFVLEVVVMLVFPLVVLSERCRLASRRVSVGERGCCVGSGVCIWLSDVVSSSIEGSGMGSASIIANVEVEEYLDCDSSTGLVLTVLSASLAPDSWVLGSEAMLMFSSDLSIAGVCCVGVVDFSSWPVISSSSTSREGLGLSCAESVFVAESSPFFGFLRPVLAV